MDGNVSIYSILKGSLQICLEWNVQKRALTYLKVIYLTSQIDRKSKFVLTFFVG